jgi:hypothetical protein
LPVDERRRLQLADAAKRALGDDEGITLMELLPPVGWADVATKQDVALLQHDLLLVKQELLQELTLRDQRVDTRLERGFRQIMVTMTTLLVAAFFATVLAAVLR